MILHDSTIDNNSGSSNVNGSDSGSGSYGQDDEK
jgi:hypothetical protein